MAHNLRIVLGVFAPGIIGAEGIVPKQSAEQHWYLVSISGGYGRRQLRTCLSRMKISKIYGGKTYD
jgi:hypothetical protein